MLGHCHCLSCQSQPAIPKIALLFDHWLGNTSKGCKSICIILSKKYISFRNLEKVQQISAPWLQNTAFPGGGMEGEREGNKRERDGEKEWDGGKEGGKRWGFGIVDPTQGLAVSGPEGPLPGWRPPKHLQLVTSLKHAHTNRGEYIYTSAVYCVSADNCCNSITFLSYYHTHTHIKSSCQWMNGWI